MTTKTAHHADCHYEIAADRTYANGDCQVLAAAIQQITGWDIALFEGAGNHVTVITPNGQHLDTHGLRDAKDIATQWESDQPTTIGHIDNLGWLGCGTCVCDIRTARDTIQRAGLLTDDIARAADWEIDSLVD